MKKSLLITTSILALGLSATPAAAQWDYALSSGAQCMDYRGVRVDNSHCSGLTIPNPISTGSCGGGSSYSGGGSYGGGGSPGSDTGYYDTNADGIADSTSCSGSCDMSNYNDSANRMGGTTGYGWSSGHGGGGDGGKVLCTYFYGRGELPAKIYQADADYAARYISEQTRSGYHRWAVPLVQHLQKNPDGLAVKFLRPFVKAWAYEMAYLMNVVETPNYLGKTIRVLGEPLCRVLGGFVKKTDHRILYV